MRVGAYEVLREIGRGSMGAVYLARRDGLERTFALKAMNKTSLADPEAVLRFKQEARLASRIDHVGVVPVIDAGEVDGVPFYVMGYCEGDTLHAHLKRGPLAPLDAARIVRELADAVSAAHNAGCIHRDLKPGNVILEAATGRPKITDFGLARDQSSQERLTRTGEVLGTPFYMAPEQVRGDRSVDERIDVYALGVILYECLSGSHPYTGTSSAVIAQNILQGRATPLRAVRKDVPRGLDSIVDRAIAPDREERFESAAALRDALDAFIETGGDAERDLGRFALRLAALTFAVVLLTAGTVGVVVLRRRSAAAEAAQRAEVDRADRLEAERKAEREAATRRQKEERAAALAAEKKKNDCPDLNGLWKGVYGPHGEEIVEVVHVGDDVVATKVTGDANVPAGQITWRARLIGKKGDGEAQIAGTGFRSPRFIKGRLTVIDADTIEFTWADVGNSIVFTRAR